MLNEFIKDTFKRFPVWRVMGKTVRGASHIRKDIVNQDAIMWFPQTGKAHYYALAVSDGHGSARHFRSDKGAKYAVESSVAELIKFMGSHQKTKNLSIVKNMAEEKLPQLIYNKWKEKVMEDLDNNPVTNDELEHLKAKDPEIVTDISKRPFSAYGATLLSLLVTSNYVLFLQLGDGDILTVTDEGSVYRPIPDDSRHIANETSSLSMNDAWREFRIYFQVLPEIYPAMFLLSTDGYANSFPNESDFLKVGSDILEMVKENGIKKVDKNLERWLNEASQMGSGDDITLGIVLKESISKTNI